MVNFLKLTGVIINTKFITQILINPQKYVFYLNNGQFGGFMLIGSGSINTQNLKMDVCEITPTEKKNETKT